MVKELKKIVAGMYRFGNWVISRNTMGELGPRSGWLAESEKLDWAFFSPTLSDAVASIKQMERNK